MDDQSHRARDANIDLPPILGAWPRLYGAVLCYLLILIAALYAFSRLFSY